MGKKNNHAMSKRFNYWQIKVLYNKVGIQYVSLLHQALWNSYLT